MKNKNNHLLLHSNLIHDKNVQELDSKHKQK